MRVNISSVLWLAAVSAITTMVVLSPVLANGRSPGVRLLDVDVKATCVDATDTEHAIVRAKIDGKRALTIKAGIAEIELPLAQARVVSFLPPEQASGDYLAATLDFEGNHEESMVKVKKEGQAVMLSGFDSSGLKLRVPLMQCKSISFEPMITGGSTPSVAPVSAN